MKLYPHLLVILISFTCLQTSTDVIVTTGQDNPFGVIPGEITLRDAINTINSGGGGEIIAFSPNVGVIQLLEPLPVITEQVTIDGLAQIMGTEIIPGSCNALPSPVTNPNLFSNLLPITIDGSQIPSSSTDLQVGLFFDSSSTESEVRGIRIQNMTGTDQAPSAGGIFAQNITQNITVECCMVENILCKNDQPNTSESTGLKNISTISTCFVKNIASSPLNFDMTLDIAQTAAATGILNLRLTEDTRIECISSGNIISKLDLLFSLFHLIAGSAYGITNSNEQALESKGCALGSGSADEKITIKNCHISHIKGGSINLIPIIQRISLDIVAGIYLTETLDTFIENSIVCDVQTGSAELPNPSELVKTEGLFGIFVENNMYGCIQHNIVKSIVAGPLEIGGENTPAELAPSVGVFADSLPLVIENNSVSGIFGGCHITTGECSSIRTETTFGNDWGTSGITALGSNSIRQITKTGSACPTPEGSESLVVVCNNQVNNVSGGARTAAEKGALVSDFGSIGIGADVNGTLIVNNNTITNITGTNFCTKAPDSSSLLRPGTKGILALGQTTQVCSNEVITIREGNISTSLKSAHSNGEDLILITTLPPLGLFSSDSPAQTTGITIQQSSQASFLSPTVADNYIKNITGSQPAGSGVNVASIGVGIAISPNQELSKQNNIKKSKQTRILTQCGSNLNEGAISNNTITAITSHITRPAYGVLSNQLENLLFLRIENNTINAICGGGAALTQNITNNVPNLDFCALGTQVIEELIIIPSTLPYEPTSSIYLLASNCVNVNNNTIETAGKIMGQARGITTTASSDIEIFENSITKITGPGIFVGGAPVPVGSNVPSDLEIASASVRNVIHTNNTLDNIGKGIELGISNWGNLFELVSLFLGSDVPPTTTIVGNHNQVAPKIERVICNNRGTVTIGACLNDPRHPDSDFIIQFFVNSTNDVPHGETPISDFDGSEFIMTTNENGTAHKIFTFMPLAAIQSGDNITAHVTLIRDGSEDIGDTSEFGVETKPQNILEPLSQKPKPFTFNQFLCT